MKTQHKLVVVPLVVMLFVSVVGIVAIETYMENQLVERSRIELRWLAASSLESVRTVELVGNVEQQDLLQAFHRLARRFAHAADVRITYMDANGRVLGDSDIAYEKLPGLESLLNRQEVREALERGQGIAQHYSQALQQDMLYVAVSSNEEHYTDSTSHLAHPLIARASRPLTMIREAIYELRMTLFLIGSLTIISVLALGVFAARMLGRVVQREQQLLEKRVKSRTTEISTLQAFGGLLNACSTLDEAGEVMVNVIPKLLPDLKGGVSIIKSSRNRLDSIASWGGEWPGMEQFPPTACWALRKGHQHISQEYDIQVLCSHWNDISDQQTLCIPLLAQGETIGVLHFVMENRDALEDSRHLWSAMAEQIGLTLANIQLRDSLREQAIRDALTGLFNRHYMLEALEQAASRAERINSSVAVLMLDLDHFKRFNDNFGHDAGDYVLKTFATVLQESTRQEDTVCRYGGEEFCIICPFVDEQQALLVAQRIIKSTRSLELSMNQLPLGVVTASIGVAIFPDHAITIEDTLKAADEALYLAKEQGRDCVVVSKPTTAKENATDEASEDAE